MCGDNLDDKHFYGEIEIRTEREEVGTMSQTLQRYDVTSLVGIAAVAIGSAIWDETDDTVEVPELNELMAAAAIARCLTPVRLRGFEIKAMRKIMGCTLTELAKKLDEKTATETISRWESEAQPMGGYAEKLFRLLVCEALKDQAPGVDYHGSMIAELRVLDPWMADPNYELPPLEFRMALFKPCHGRLENVWHDLKSAA